jgi:hypothetical protein
LGDHRPVLAVNRLEFWCFGLPAGGIEDGVVFVQGEFSAPQGPTRTV